MLQRFRISRTALGTFPFIAGPAGDVGGHPDLCRGHAGDAGSSCGRAHRASGIGFGEDHSGFREPLQVGRVDFWIAAVVVDPSRSQVVGHDKDDVGFPGRGGKWEDQK